MNRRIAKKIVDAKKHVHTWDRTVRAHKRLGLPAPEPEYCIRAEKYVLGVDKGEEGEDFTGIHVITEQTKTGRLSSFNYRTGKAPVHLEGAIVPPIVAEDTTPLTVHTDLEQKTLPELKELAKVMGIKGFSGLKKTDLIAVIRLSTLV